MKKNYKELGDCIDLLCGFAFESDKYLTDREGIRLLRGDNVIQGVVRWEDAKIWPTENLTELKRYQLEVGDVVIAMDRTWVNAGIKCARIRKCDTPSLLVQRVARIRGKGADTGYIGQVMQTHRFIQHVKGTQTESAVPHISSQQIREFQFFAPPLPEQQKIADILGTWDEALEKLDALIAAKARRKQALMQQLLTGHRRLPGSGAPVKFIHASDIFTNRTERNSRGAPILSVTQDQGVVVRATLDRKIAHDIETNDTYKIVQPGDYIISLRSFQGGLEYSEILGAVSPAYHVIHPIKDIDREFYRHYFKSADFVSRLAVAVIGIRDGKQISFTDFGFIKLPYPDIDDQKLIGQLLSTADAELRLQRQQRTALDRQKRGLMQQLLTGKIRTL